MAPVYDTEAKRWQAVQNRDQAASSSFIYAVISTKIYCRPACPSRTARRANVCFYDTAKDATAAGYRPCLRCKPDQCAFDPDKESAPRDAVRRACAYIVATDGRAKFPDVAKHVGLSTRYLYGQFKTVMGTTPAKYAAGLKTNRSVQSTPEGLSETPSAASDAVTPLFNENLEVVDDSDSWNMLFDPDFNEFAMLYQDTEPLFQHNEHNTSGVLLSSTTAELAVDDDACNFMLRDPFEISTSSNNSKDPAPYLYPNQMSEYCPD